jgi:hypothetical protein
MWPPALKASDRPAYLNAQAKESTKTRVEVDLLDLDHKHLHSLDYELIDGQVDFTKGTDVSRLLQAGFFDPGDDLLDLDLRHLLRVRHHLWVPDLDEYVVTPLFTGQVVVPSSDGDLTTLEAHGKETFALQPGAPRRTWREGRSIAGCIRDMFEDIGETKFRISRGLKAELKEKMESGGRDSNKYPWRVAQRMVKKAGYQLFYDELGFLTLRRRPKKPVQTWTEDSGKVNTPIGFTRDLREVRNTVHAFGKKKLDVIVYAPRKHLFSAQTLRRGGKLGRRTEYLDLESVGNREELRKAANDRLDELLTDVSTATFECLPTYHVGPFDRVKAVKRNGKFGEFFPEEASIPLGDGAMTVGYQQRVRRQSAGRIRL